MSDNKADIFWVYLRHGFPGYEGGMIGIDLPKGRPWSFGLRCELRRSDGKFVVAEEMPVAYLAMGTAIAAEDIAFFVREEDDHLFNSNKTAEYFYDIVKPGLMRNSSECPCDHCPEL